MAKQAKGPKVEHFRISLIDDMTHKQLWVMRFTRVSFFVFLISAVMVIMAVSFSLIAYTPIRTFIPGYPDAHTKRAAINNAIKVDSLQNVIYTWMFYADNLKKVMEGEDPVAIDSIIRNTASEISAEKAKKNLGERDSLLRENVKQAEQFGHSFERELVYLFTHSVLHLLGYDHMEDDEKKAMREREEEIMKQLDALQFNANVGNN